MPAPFWPLVAPNGPHTWSRRPSICMCGALVASCLWGDRGNHCWALASSPQSTFTHQSPWILTQTPPRRPEGLGPTLLIFCVISLFYTPVYTLNVSHWLSILVCIQRVHLVFFSPCPLFSSSVLPTLVWQVTLDPNDRLMIKTGC